MARTVKVRGSVGVYVDSTRPAANFGADGNRLKLKEAQRRGLLWLKQPVPAGRTVTSATLVLSSHVGYSGSVTVSAKPLDSGFKRRSTTWANQPDTSGLATAEATLSNPDGGDKFEIDVTEHIQAAVNSGDWFGWRITTDNAAGVAVRGPLAKAGKPLLIVTYSTSPAQPTDLRPNGGAFSGGAPVVSADYIDNSGSTELASAQVQVATAEDGFGSPVFDTGVVATSVPLVDLAAEGYGPQGNGVRNYWRIRFRDGDLLWSEWSDVAELHRVTQGTLTIDNPSLVSPVVTEYTPPISWTLSGRDQERYRVTVAEASNPGEFLWDSEQITGSESSIDVPFGVLVDGREYRVTVRTWDTIEREATPGDPTAVFESRVFTVDLDPTVAPVETITTEANPNRPGALIEWTRAAQPDRWTILRNGRAIADIDGDDAFVSAGTYRYSDPTARFGKQHRYQVLAVVNRAASKNSPFSDMPLAGSNGVWLGDPDEDVWVRLSQANLDGLSMADKATLYQASGSRRPARVVTAMPGYTGTISGILSDRHDGYSREDGLDALLRIKEQPGGRFRLVGADLSIKVIVGDVTHRPHSDTTIQGRRTFVSFNVWQFSDFDYKPEY